MKISKKKLLFIILIIVVLVVAIVVKLIPKEKETAKKENTSCDERSFYLESYFSDYKPQDEQRYIFLSSYDDYPKDADFLDKNKLDKLDFDNQDYLVYFLDSQGGCDRAKRLKCVEYTNKGIELNFEYYDVNPICDAIFFDALVIELEKDKYTDNLSVKETVYEVDNEKE